MIYFVVWPNVTKRKQLRTGLSSTYTNRSMPESGMLRKRYGDVVDKSRPEI